MKLRNLKSGQVFVFALALVAIVAFHNCAPAKFKSTPYSSSAESVDGLGVSDSGDTTTQPVNRQPPGPSISPTEREPSRTECRDIRRADVSVDQGVHLVACSASSDKRCALVCHVPPGNPEAKHNIIVGLPARLGPHQPGGHGGDYDGPCSTRNESFEACREN